MRSGSSPGASERDDLAWWLEGAHRARQDVALESGGGADAELYRSESSRLTRYVLRRVGCREEARDLVQEAFSRFLGLRRAQSESLDRPAAYLQRVTRNLLIDRAKANKRRAADLHVAVDEVALAAPDQQRLLESRDMLRRLEAAMLKLKPRTREIFMAHRLDGLSYAEIAERTGLSIKGVEKQMSKAIAHLDRTLGRP